MTRTRSAVVLASAVAITAGLIVPGRAAARPNYLTTFGSLYGFQKGDDLYACGVCHRKWEGTGARNPYGTAVEQQLYLGKAVSAAILAIGADDTDGDGFSNTNEITTGGTLPGYSCDNYTLVIDPPANFQSLITPNVPSCLEPKDLLVEPTSAGFLTEVDHPASIAVDLINNGTTSPIIVSAYGMLAGSNTTLSVSGAATPITIPVGQRTTVTLSFSPTANVFATGTLRITSDDPDQPTIDIPVTGIAFVKNLAPVESRTACFKDVKRRLETFTGKHLGEWSRCYTDELRGVACDAGRRDLKIAQAEAQLRSFVGGANDRKCAGSGLTPTLLDLPTTCGAPCASISLTTIADWASCLVCRQAAATDQMLQASAGAAPPDMPLNVLTPSIYRCNRSVVKAVEQGIRKLQKTLGLCELGNVGASTPVDCAGTLSAHIAGVAAKIDAAFDRCKDTTGMLGCRFDPEADPGCLGSTAQSIATDLVNAVFDTRE
jgi:hypothetical protein